MRILKHIALVHLLTLMGCGILIGNPDSKTGGGKTPKAVSETEKKATIEDPFAQRTANGLYFAITDVPSDDVQSFWVKFSRLEIYGPAGEVVEVPLIIKDAFDLLKFKKGKSLDFASISTLPEGTYSELRLVMDETYQSTVTANDGLEYPVKIPSATESGWKIKFGLDYVKDKIHDYVLDFDVRQSLHQTGKSYSLKPVIRLGDRNSSGMIRGSSTDGNTVCVYAASQTMDSTNDCAQALASQVVSGGQYQFAFVVAGTYQLRIFAADGTYTDKSVVAVTAKNTTDVP